jgi:hypothetical protein
VVRPVGLPAALWGSEGGIFALSRSFGVRALPWIDQAGLNSVPLELSGKTDAIPTTFQAMRPADAAAKITTPIARLRSSLLCEIFFEAPDIGDALDLGADAKPRSPRHNRDVAIAEEHEMGVQLRSALEAAMDRIPAGTPRSPSQSSAAFMRVGSPSWQYRISAALRRSKRCAGSWWRSTPLALPYLAFAIVRLWFARLRFQRPSSRIDKQLDIFSLSASRWAATGLPDASATVGLFGAVRTFNSWEPWSRAVRVLCLTLFDGAR